MKLFKLTALAMSLMISVPVFAQFSNASSTTSTGSGISLIKDCNPYDRVTLDYVNRSISPKHGDSESTNGVALDYIHGFSLSQTLPIFLETGIGADFGIWSDSDYDEEIKLTTLSFSVPVNVAYKLQFTDAFSLQPYLGLNFRVNALAKYKYTEDDDYSEDWSAFDKDEMGKDGVWKRFQMGWHIGLGANFNQFYVGLSYGTDFIEICKKTNTSTFKVGVGLNF